jgi:UPF0755 protein
MTGAPRATRADFHMRILRVLLLLVSAAAAGVAGVAWTWYRTPLTLPSTPFDFEVKSGATLTSVARELNARGVLPHTLALVALARYRGVDRAIKAGSYEIEPPITLPTLLDKLTQGDVTQTAITLVEGATFAEVKRALSADADLKPTVLDLPDAEVLDRLGVAEKSAEGLFFPDTYFFAKGSTDAALLKRARATMTARLAAAWDRRAPDLPFATPYEALILASIVEKETGRPTDRPLIASVFINRLKRGMRLQTDPTVIYGIGEKFDGNLRKRDLDADTPWNTYTRDGLPPTPIALPSQASLDAVTNPPQTAFLYFVSRGDGTSEFTASLAEHNRAVSKYQKGGR